MTEGAELEVSEEEATDISNKLFKCLEHKENYEEFVKKMIVMKIIKGILIGRT